MAAAAILNFESVNNYRMHEAILAIFQPEIN